MVWNILVHQKKRELYLFAAIVATITNALQQPFSQQTAGKA